MKKNEKKTEMMENSSCQKNMFMVDYRHTTDAGIA